MRENTRFIKMRIDFLDMKFNSIVNNFEQQPAILDVDEEKEQLQAEIQELKQEIENDIMNLKEQEIHSFKPFSNSAFESFKREIQINNKIAMLQHKMKEFFN